MEVRQGANARDVKGYDTERLRNDFLIQNLFPADDFKLVYSQIDRIIVGGCMPVNKELTLEAGSELKAAYFLERREMGIFNVGGNGSVIVDGTEIFLTAEKLGISQYRTHRDHKQYLRILCYSDKRA